MKTINITIPEKLKDDAQSLVRLGYYASFSDLTRSAIRRLIQIDDLDKILLETKKDQKNNKATVLTSEKDIDTFFETIK